MKLDLHLHTTCSDGQLTPEELVRLASDRGLDAIAITDHDTVDGIDPALIAATFHNNLEIVPGIEINTFFGKQEVHVLGYYIDYNNSEFETILKKLQGQREERSRKIVEKLVDLGLYLDLEDVLSKVKGSSIGRPHIAEALVEKGYVGSAVEAFEKYLNCGKPAYVPREKMSPFEAIDIIKGFGGIPVLAHPGLLEEPSIIGALIERGLMGIEAYHIKHTPEQTEHYRKFAIEKDLIITGGSDSHDASNVGAVEVPGDALEALKKAKSISKFA
jgi:predicted metal-dependent phosphoesterase TrpH